MPTAGFIATFSFPYRGTDEEWSQGYHIADAWVNEADFRASMDDFRVAVEDVLSARSHILRFIGYDDFSPHHAHTYLYDVASHAFVGARGTDGETPMPGDTAVWARWVMARRSTKGKPVYLRKYFHDVWADEDGDPDLIASNMHDALISFGNGARTAGFNGHLIADRFGATTLVDVEVSQWITTRTLERRGRRRPPA